MLTLSNLKLDSKSNTPTISKSVINSNNILSNNDLISNVPNNIDFQSHINEENINDYSVSSSKSNLSEFIENYANEEDMNTNTITSEISNSNRECNNTNTNNNATNYVYSNSNQNNVDDELKANLNIKLNKDQKEKGVSNKQLNSNNNVNNSVLINEELISNSKNNTSNNQSEVDNLDDIDNITNFSSQTNNSNQIKIQISNYTQKANYNDLKKIDRHKCSNSNCRDRLELLDDLKLKYNEAEKIYFELAQNRNRQNDQLEEIYSQKLVECNTLQNISNIYEKQYISNLPLTELYDLEKKVNSMLDGIRKCKSSIVENEKNKQIHENSKSKTCVICYENISSVLIRPCNHLCVCSKCNCRVYSCPICRGFILNKVKVKFIEKS